MKNLPYACSEMVNTFLPFCGEDGFQRSVECLDNVRLSKQIADARMIYDLLTSSTSSKKMQHPATHMWKGYESALIQYHNAAISEHRKRRGGDAYSFLEEEDVVMPDWYGCLPLHYSHQASLLRKNRCHYSRYFCPPDAYLKLGYLWVGNNSTTKTKRISLKSLIELDDIDPDPQYFNTPQEENPHPEYSCCKLADLQTEARGAGIRVTGMRKEQLFALLRLGMSSAESEKFSMKKKEKNDLESLTVAELRKLLRNHSRSGIYSLKKCELVRLARELESNIKI
jgi:hypothetical protein